MGAPHQKYNTTAARVFDVMGEIRKAIKSYEIYEFDIESEEAEVEEEEEQWRRLVGIAN